MRIIIKFLIILSCFFYLSCERETNSSPINDESGQVNVSINEQKSFEKPSGNEIKIAINKKAFDEYEIAVTNISKKPVFCGYLPRPNSNYADFFAYGVYWRKSESEAFTPDFDDGHFSPPTVAIDPGKTVRTMFYPSKSGQYRITLGYTTDAEVARILNTVPFDERSKEVNSRMDEAFTTTNSPIFNVSGIKNQ